MANRRMISKSISTSKKLSRVSLLAKLIYTWTIPHTDDYGCMDGDADSIKSIVIPREKISIADIEKALDDLQKNELILRYSNKVDTFLQIVNFNEHQTFRTDRDRRHLYPAPSDIPETYQCHTNDVPAGDIVRLSKVKLSKDKIREEKVYLTFGEFENVRLTEEEHNKLGIKYGHIKTHEKIEELSMGIESHGYKYKSHYAAILSWDKKNKKPEDETSPELKAYYDKKRKEREENAKTTV